MLCVPFGWPHPTQTPEVATFVFPQTSHLQGFNISTLKPGEKPIVHSDYGMYSFLSFLEEKEDVVPLENLTTAIFLDYIKNSKPVRQREILCEIRKICRYLKRDDLLMALSGIHAPRHHRIIPVLETDEQERIGSCFCYQFGILIYYL